MVRPETARCNRRSTVALRVAFMRVRPGRRVRGCDSAGPRVPGQPGHHLQHEDPHSAAVEESNARRAAMMNHDRDTRCQPGRHPDRRRGPIRGSVPPATGSNNGVMRVAGPARPAASSVQSATACRVEHGVHLALRRPAAMTPARLRRHPGIGQLRLAAFGGISTVINPSMVPCRSPPDTTDERSVPPSTIAATA